MTLQYPYSGRAIRVVFSRIRSGYTANRAIIIDGVAIAKQCTDASIKRTKYYLSNGNTQIMAQLTKILW